MITLRPLAISDLDTMTSLVQNPDRLVDTGAPMYVNMKITRMQGTNRIIIGVSIIDAQMKQRELAEKLTKENQTAGRRQKMAGEKLRKNRKKA